MDQRYVMIGSGAFGSVYKKDQKDQKYVIKIGKYSLAEFIILEYIMILSLNPNGNILFMSNAKSVELINGSVSLIMDDYGLNLMQYGSNLLLKDRILLLELILLQSSNVLMFLKTNKIIHMDIKGENICIDKNQKLIFIDWGFAGRYLGDENHEKYADCYVGTHSHADPKQVKSPTHIKFSCDIFSMVMTCLSFVRQTHIDPIKDIDESLTMDMGILNLYHNIHILYGYEKGSKYVDILNSMLELDSNKRITADALYIRLHGTEYVPPIEPSPPPIKYLPNTTYDKAKLYSKVSIICLHFKILHLYDYMIYLYEKLDEQIYIDNTNCEHCILSCILIANWTIHHHSKKIISIDTTLKKIIKNAYSREDLIDLVLTNIQILKYHILKFDFSTITPKILIETETQTDPPQQKEVEAQTDPPQQKEVEAQTDPPQQKEIETQTDSPQPKDAYSLLQKLNKGIMECDKIKDVNIGVKRFSNTCHKYTPKKSKN
jgi:serine/threonine protein kinase